MYDQIIEKINRGRGQQIAAFFLLWFAIYSLVWTIIEPLGFAIRPQQILRWRIIYVSSTLILSILIYFSFFFRKRLQRFGLLEGDTDLMSTAKLSGQANISIIADGMHGQVYQIITQSQHDRIDWVVKASAHKAKSIIFVYTPTPDLFFYARVNVLSKNKQSATPKWLRFETSESVFQSTLDHEEMGVPVTATDDAGYLRLAVNIDHVVNKAFGRYGWRCDKILEIRARRSGKIKSIELR